MYNYKFENGHCIVDIDGYKWMIDSAYTSVSYKRNVNCLVIDDKKYSLPFNPTSKTIVDKVVGISVDGIIGCDILSKTSFSLDNEGNFCFDMSMASKENYVDIAIYSIHPSVNDNVIIGKITIDCEEVDVLFDTGAHINYIDPDLVVPSILVDKKYDLEDFDFSGRKIISIRHIEICEIGDFAYKVHFGIPKVGSYPISVMNGTHSLAILGLYDFGFNQPIFNKCFGIDYKNKKLFIR